MCLILLAHRTSARFPLILAGNRDEFYARPTAPAGFWPPGENVLGGRDLSAGGTWLAASRQGRLSVVTNHRSGRPAPAPRSRGELVSAFVEGSALPEAHLAALSPLGSLYGGFNLLLWHQGELHYGSNRGIAQARVETGVHGLSNDLLDSPWPKVEMGKRRLEALLQHDPADPVPALFDMLADRAEAAEGELPDTGVPREWERRLSAAFIHSGEYGTRASTVVLVDATGHLSFVERSFDRLGRMEGERRFRIEGFCAI